MSSAGSRRGRDSPAIDQEIDLAGGKAGEFHLEIDLDQLRGNALQQIEVPDRPFGQAVVGDHDRALLVLGEAADRQRRDLGHAERLAASSRPWPARMVPFHRSGSDLSRCARCSSSDWRSDDLCAFLGFPGTASMSGSALPRSAPLNPRGGRRIFRNGANENGLQSTRRILRPADTGSLRFFISRNVAPIGANPNLQSYFLRFGPTGSRSRLWVIGDVGAHCHSYGAGSVASPARNSLRADRYGLRRLWSANHCSGGCKASTTA